MYWAFRPPWQRGTRALRVEDPISGEVRGFWLQGIKPLGILPQFGELAGGWDLVYRAFGFRMVQWPGQDPELKTPMA